jgi:hypothetical protein
MLGFRRVAVHLALFALLLRAFLPAGWMPAAQGGAPLVMCSVIADTSGGSHTRDSLPGKDDPRAHEMCAFGGMPAIAPAGAAIFFTPMPADGDPSGGGGAPTGLHPQDHAPQIPRAPPPSI